MMNDAKTAAHKPGPSYNLSLLAELRGHHDRLWQVSWSPVALMLLSASGDNSVRVWRPAPTWEHVAVAEDAHSRTVRTVAFNPDGRMFATGSFDATVGIWEKQEGEQGCAHSAALAGNVLECIATLEGHENEVKSVAWAVSGALLATCSRDKSVWIWEVIGNGEFECCCVLQEHTQDVKMVLWHPAEEILASASYDDTIKIWREEDADWYCAETLVGHESTVWAIDFNCTGTMIASVSDDKSLRIWRQSDADGKYHPYAILQNLHDRSIYSVSWSKHHDLIATAAGDNSIKICRLIENDVANGKIEIVSELKEPHGPHDVNSVAWCPLQAHQTLLASAGDDEAVRIWNMNELA